MPYKTVRYAKKVGLRNTVSQMTTVDFTTLEEFYAQDIWDLKYISTSDDEDSDPNITSDEESEEENEEEGEVAQKLPPLFKKLKSVGTKGPPRVQYEYRYSNDPDD
jgi:hypothetical protein